MVERTSCEERQLMHRLGYENYVREMGQRSLRFTNTEIVERGLGSGVFVATWPQSKAESKSKVTAMRCSFHPNGDVEAVGACTACGRGVCDACAVTIQGRMLCRCCVDTVPVDTSRKHAEERNLKLKDPASAAAMSMLHGGLGQIYNGEIAKGVGLAGAKILILIIAIMLFANGTWHYAIPLLIFGWGGLWAFGIWDAYGSASRHNKRQFELGPNANDFSRGHY
jgi:hypothetical protein